MVMGRPNKGVDHVDSCEGSRMAKQRAKIVLRTITGELSVHEGMGKIDIQRAQFAKLRNQMLQAAVSALEPGRPGRPRKHDAETDHRLGELSSKVADLEQKLEIERAKAKLAPLLVGRNDGQKGGSTTRQERRKRARELRKRAVG